MLEDKDKFYRFSPLSSVILFTLFSFLIHINSNIFLFLIHKLSNWLSNSSNTNQLHPKTVRHIACNSTHPTRSKTIKLDSTDLQHIRSFNNQLIQMCLLPDLKSDLTSDCDPNPNIEKTAYRD